jgi:D-aminopeptidase
LRRFLCFNKGSFTFIEMKKKNQKNQKRFRDYGFCPGFLKPGKRNSIADVAGITVGHASLMRGTDVRTGVTVIDPGIPDLFHKKIPAAFYAAKGTGKVAGSSQVEELGTLEAPVALTNTLAVGTVTRAMVDLVLANNKLEKIQTPNVFVGECNDGILNDVHKDSVTPKEVRAAYRDRVKDFALGNVGAGTGTRAFSWKGGIGTSSRCLTIGNKSYVIGALVQTNYGGALEVMGVPIGKIFKKTDYEGIVPPDTDGSCMMVLATDAPLTARQLGRLAKRAIMGLARTGTVMRTVSGDFVLAFSTSRVGLEGSGVVAPGSK